MRDSMRPATEIQMPSRAVEGSRLRKVVGRIASRALRSPRAAADIELAIGEAFSNVLKHGAKKSRVSVRVESPSNHELAVEMTYPGKRFDTTVTRPKDVGKARGGFGRHIIQQVMDSMEYSFRRGRTTLRMTKRR